MSRTRAVEETEIEVDISTIESEEERGIFRLILLSQQDIDPDRLIFDGVDTTVVPDTGKEGPTFSAAELTKVFFGRSSHWIRWLEREGRTVLDGRPVAITRTEKGARKYNLAEVELLAHALAQNGAINAAQLRLALLTARNIALQWGILS